MERLCAGPVLNVGGVRVIPIARELVSSCGNGVFASKTPLAVVLVREGEVSVRDAEGCPDSVAVWLERLPGLGALIDGKSDAICR